MPVQIIATEGVIARHRAAELHCEIVELFLSVHGLSGNRFMQPNVIGEVVFVDPDLSFANKASAKIVVVELRVPSFAFPDQQIKNEFVAQATRLVIAAAEGRLAAEQVWVNAVFAVDGLWGIGGKAYSNDQLLEEISAAG